jgi:aspartyl-tRNA(Asn)/glutamyl-tRNA(Gln) amidotransferase subunit C
MPVTIHDVEHIAQLAHLEFSPDEKQKLMQEMNQILEYMEQLNKLDTDSVEPLSHVIDLKNVFREDAAKPGLPAGDALKNAPSKTDEFFKVPKVIGEKE